MPSIASVSPRNSYDWIEYFYQNSPDPCLPWDDAYRLSAAERFAVAASIQQFQLGENAGGTRLLQRAQLIANSSGDKGYIPALKLFIREEQRHSWMLAKFLDTNGIGCLQQHWTHVFFRKIRCLAGFELCMRVLSTAEVIARPYYTALRDATGSSLLRAICERILTEEAVHLRFQGFTFEWLQQRRHPQVRAAVTAVHRWFLLLLATAVWIEHRKVFRASGYSWQLLWKKSREEFQMMVDRHSRTATV